MGIEDLKNTIEIRNSIDGFNCVLHTDENCGSEPSDETTQNENVEELVKQMHRERERKKAFIIFRRSKWIRLKLKN